MPLYPHLNYAFSVNSKDVGWRVVTTLPHKTSHKTIKISLQDLEQNSMIDVPEEVSNCNKTTCHRIFASFVHENHVDAAGLVSDGKITRMACTLEIEHRIWDVMEFDPVFNNIVLGVVVPEKFGTIVSEMKENKCYHCSTKNCEKIFSSFPRLLHDDCNRLYYQYPFIVHSCNDDDCNYTANKVRTQTNVTFSKNIHNNKKCKSIFCVWTCGETSEYCDRCASNAYAKPTSIFYNDTD